MPVPSSAERERTTVASVGEFTAFMDGRINIRFYDRTLLDMDSEHGRCRLVLPSGEVEVINLATRDTRFDW